MRILAQVCAHGPRAGPEARLQQSTATTPCATELFTRLDSRLRDISRATSGGKEEKGNESWGLMARVAIHIRRRARELQDAKSTALRAVSYRTGCSGCSASALNASKSPRYRVLHYCPRLTLPHGRRAEEATRNRPGWRVANHTEGRDIAAIYSSNHCRLLDGKEATRR